MSAGALILRPQRHTTPHPLPYCRCRGCICRLVPDRLPDCIECSSEPQRVSAAAFWRADANASAKIKSMILRFFAGVLRFFAPCKKRCGTILRLIRIIGQKIRKMKNLFDDFAEFKVQKMFLQYFRRSVFYHHKVWRGGIVELHKPPVTWHSRMNKIFLLKKVFLEKCGVGI